MSGLTSRLIGPVVRRNSLSVYQTRFFFQSPLVTATTGVVTKNRLDVREIYDRLTAERLRKKIALANPGEWNP